MFSENFIKVLENEGVVTIVSWADGEPHLVNTWNSFTVVTEDQRLLIPAYAMRKTEKNTTINPRVKLTLGSKNVTGYNDYPGTGFVLEGTASFIESGAEYDMMKEKFDFLTRVLEVKVTKSKQML